MSMIAFAFLQSLRLKQLKGGKESPDRHQNQVCPGSGKPSLTGFPIRRIDRAHIVDTGPPMLLFKICQSSANPLLRRAATAALHWATSTRAFQFDLPPSPKMAPGVMLGASVCQSGRWKRRLNTQPCSLSTQMSL